MEYRKKHMNEEVRKQLHIETVKNLRCLTIYGKILLIYPKNPDIRCEPLHGR